MSADNDGISSHHLKVSSHLHRLCPMFLLGRYIPLDKPEKKNYVIS
jgi:hypothetical protein